MSIDDAVSSFITGHYLLFSACVLWAIWCTCQVTIALLNTINVIVSAHSVPKMFPQGIPPHIVRVRPPTEPGKEELP